MRRKPLPIGATVHPSIAITSDAHSKSPEGHSIKPQLPPSYSSLVAQGLNQESHLNIDTKHVTRAISTQHLNAEKFSSGEAASDLPSLPYDTQELGKTIKRTDDSVIGLEQSNNQHLADAFFNDQSSSEALSAGLTIIDDSASAKGNQPKASKLLRAFEETSHFLGGLITHPTESTKHFSILRHGQGVIYYRGPSTKVVLTVFSDRPLPSDRRYWLQMKGWSGQRGMKMKAVLRTNSSWLNVTPTTPALATDLPTLDERAWQRDIKKFQSKMVKPACIHPVRETVVLRVPSEAVDGYFRAVLTSGSDRAVLCPSPVFRLASTSMSASSLKGASLATLPIELGINIMQYAARQVTTNLITPYAELAQKGVNQAVPQNVSTYAPLMYSASGAEGFVNSVGEQHDLDQAERSEQAGIERRRYVPLQRSDIEGDESGPTDQFPFTLSSKVTRGSGQGLIQTGMPTANLDLIPADQISSMRGLYFGWAFITPKDGKDRHLHAEWRHAIISIDYVRSEKPHFAPRKGVKAYLLHNFNGHDFVNAKVEIIVMGYLRPIIDPSDRETFFSETLRDIEITRASLERENWTAEEGKLQLKHIKSGRSLLERGIAARMATQRTFDRVPVHFLGMRTESTTLSDRGMYGNGGLYIVRDDLDIRSA